MNRDLDPSIWDDTFHGCAFAAYVELAVASGGIPDEAARRRAYQLYEEALAERHAVLESDELICTVRRSSLPREAACLGGRTFGVNPTVTNVV